MRLIDLVNASEQLFAHADAEGISRERLLIRLWTKKRTQPRGATATLGSGQGPKGYIKPGLTHLSKPGWWVVADFPVVRVVEYCWKATTSSVPWDLYSHHGELILLAEPEPALKAQTARRSPPVHHPAGDAPTIGADR